jgi:hypothetical protein
MLLFRGERERVGGGTEQKRAARERSEWLGFECGGGGKPGVG